MSSPSHTQDAEPTLTCFLHLTALPSWLAMTRPERNEFVEQRLTPIVTAAAADVSIRWIDVEAFTADCSDVVIAECRSLDAWNSFVEALRDTPIFSVPLFQLDRVLVGVEEGFRRHEEST